MGIIKKTLIIILISSFSISLANTSPLGIAESSQTAIPISNPNTISSLDESQSAWIIFGGDTIEEDDDVEAVRWGTNKTYEILRAKGFPHEKIYFLGPEVYPITQPYTNDSATVVNLQWAIEEWAPLHVNSSQSLGLYFLSHGDINALAALVGDALWANQLSSYLDTFEAKTGCKRILVVIEGCYSGSFHDNLSKDNRIIITSTSTYQGASFNEPRNWGLFSESFWSSIVFCKTIGRSFDIAVDYVHAQGSGQQPQLDDNHDGIGQTPYPNDDLPTGTEGYDAYETKIQYAPMACPSTAEIMKVPLHMYETYDPFTSSAVIEVEIENPALLDKVYARFFPVDWTAYDPLDGYLYPLNDDAVQMIELESPTMNEVFIGDVAFDGLALGDSFKVNIYAYDTNGYLADMVSTYLTFNADGTAPLDIIPPSVYIVNPDPDDVVKGTIEVTVTGDDNQQLENIDLYLDGVLVDSIPMPSYYPYPELIYECDTAAYAEGSHNFTAVAIDHQGLTNQSTVLVTFRNIETVEHHGFSILIGTGAIVLMVSITILRTKKKGKFR